MDSDVTTPIDATSVGPQTPQNDTRTLTTEAVEIKKDTRRKASRLIMWAYVSMMLLSSIPVIKPAESEAVTAALNDATKNAAVYAIDALGHEAVVDGLVATTEAALKADIRVMSPELAEQKNPDKRPMIDIIKEGVSEYGKPVYYDSQRTDKNHKEYVEDLKKIFLDGPIGARDIIGFLEDNPEAQGKIHKLKDLSITALGPVMREGNDGYAALHSVYDLQYGQKSGFAKRAGELRLKYPVPMVVYAGRTSEFARRALGLQKSPGQQTEQDAYFETNLKFAEMDSEMDDQVMTTVEEVVAQIKTKAEVSPDKQVSSSAVLAIFLEKDDGNLSMAIHDTAIFYKILTRGYRIGLPTGHKLRLLMNDSMPLFRDEFSTHATHFGFEDQGDVRSSRSKYTYELESDPRKKDLEILNLIGQPYHAFNAVAMLQYYPPELVKLAVLSQQGIGFKDQGRVKTLSDITVLHEFDELLDYFAKESDPAHEVKALLKKLAQ